MLACLLLACLLPAASSFRNLISGVPTCLGLAGVTSPSGQPCGSHGVRPVTDPSRGRAGGQAGRAGGRDGGPAGEGAPLPGDEVHRQPEKLDDPGALEEGTREQDYADDFDGPITYRNEVLVGTAWDLKRGGAAHDVRSAEGRRRLQAQIAASSTTWWAPECKTFSRARGKPVPGAAHWPPALRSRDHPHGLPGLTKARRAADREKVDTGNDLARITFMDAERARAAGAMVVVENPANSFMWDLPEARALAAAPGMMRVDFSNCMFDGGARNKRTAIITNSEAIAAEFRGRVCRGRGLCDRTGLQHLSWTPTVSGGQITAYMTEGEAEYPRGLGDAVGRALVKIRAEAPAATAAAGIAFTEVFAGPRAVLSARVARHLAVDRASSC